jgi:predicted phage-related endonuclease
VASSVTQADPEAELKRLDRRIRMLESDAKEIANQLDQFLKHAHSGKTKVPDSGRSSSPQDGKPSVK